LEAGVGGEETTDIGLSFSFLPPADWSWIPVRAGSDAAIAAIVDEVCAKLPSDQVAEARAVISEEFGGRVANAARLRGVDLYVPPVDLRTLSTAAMILVAEVLVPRVAASDPERIVDQILDDRPHARRGGLDGAIGVRTDSADHVVVETNGIPVVSRRVEYALAVPGDRDGRWLSIAFTALADGLPEGVIRDQVAEFDASMATLRWAG
jgi:hypothetical protein